MTGNGQVGHAFISYAPADAAAVARMQEALEESGTLVWTDSSVLPGDDWRATIRRAISNDALAFVACFSRNSLAAGASQQNEELNLAFEQLRLHRPGVPWLIPVRLDDCVIPDVDIGAGRTLTSIHPADLFGAAADEETRRLVIAIRRILGDRGELAAAGGTSSSVDRQGDDPAQGGTSKEDGPATEADAKRAAAPVAHGQQRESAASLTDVLLVSVGVLNMVAALLALRWSFFKVVSIVTLIFAGTATWHFIRRLGRSWTDRAVLFSSGACIVAILVLAATYLPAGIGAGHPVSGGTASMVTLSWRHPVTTHTAFQTRPAVADGTIVVGGDNGTIYAFSAKDGTIRWAAPEPGSFLGSTARIVHGVVYIGNADGTIYALDVATGRDWSYRTGQSIESALLVADRTIYSADGSLAQALDSSTREVRWTHAIGTSISGVGLAESGGLIYAGNTDGMIYAVAARSGDLRWKFSAESAIQTTPLIAEGNVYVGEADGVIEAVDARSGHDIWQYATGSAIQSSLVVADGILYAGNDGTGMYAINADSGKLLWKQSACSADLCGAIASGPALYHGSIYAGSFNGVIYAWNAASGTPEWHYTLKIPRQQKSRKAYSYPEALISDPPAIHDILYVADSYGRIYAIRLTTKSRR